MRAGSGGRGARGAGAQTQAREAAVGPWKEELETAGRISLFFLFNDTWGEGLYVSKSCKISVLSNILVIRNDD